MAIDSVLEPGLPVDPLQGQTEVDVSGFDMSPVDGETAITELPDGGVEVDFDPNADPEAIDVPFDANLAEHMDESALGTVAKDLIGLYEKDELARKDWKDTYKNGLDLLGLQVEERVEPWTGACGITHPLLAEAVVRFQSQQIGEMFPAAGPVRTKIVGKEDTDKVNQATRVKNFMNYLVTEQMEEYREEIDKLLFTLPLAGSAFKKTYYSIPLGRAVSEYVPAEDLVVGSGTKSMSTCRRMTHINNTDPNDIKKLQLSGFYRQVEIQDNPPEIGEVAEKKEEIVGVEGRYEDGELVTLLEIQADIDLEGFEDKVEFDGALPVGSLTGIALPYVVTIDKARSVVLSIRRNWLEDDAEKKRRQHFTHYQYIPGLGFYGLGLIHLIGGIAKGSTSILRQLVDAGTLSNLPGGFKARGLRVKGDQTPIAAGEWRDVDVPGGKISDNLFPLPYGEPSQVLAELLGVIVEEGRRFASLTDVNISSMNNEAPVGTTLALLERNLKVMTAISARIHASHRAELKILASIVKDYYTEYPYDIDEGNGDLVADFDSRVDILPVSDPNSSTMAQRVMQFQTALQLAAQHPTGFPGIDILYRGMLSSLEIQDVEEILPLPEDILLLDPVSENQNLLNLKSVRAYAVQDHQAHIQVHMMAMQDPKIGQLLENSPTAQQSYAASMAHVTEHLAFEYRNQIEADLGVTLPPEGEALPPEVEAELSRLIAQAASQLFNRNTAEIQAQQNKQAQEDPVVQDQLENTRIKALEAETRKKSAEDKTEMDLAKLIQKHEIDTEKLELQQAMDTERIRAQLLGKMLEAASRTEQIDSAESIKVAEFIMKQIEMEEDGVRDFLEKEVTGAQKNLKFLIDMVNKANE
jgi:hypothetical protein